MNDDQRKIDLFGLSIDAVTLDQAAQCAAEGAALREPMLTVTPNTDHFLRWQRSKEFQATYEAADLVVADGMPVVWLSRILGTPLPERVTGIDLFSRTCELASDRRIAIAIVGGAPGVAEKARTRLMQKYPKLDVYYTHSPSASELRDPEALAAMARGIERRQQKIVAICLGSPKQEELFVALRSRVSGGSFLAVGAAVDFWAGEVKRAPMLVQKTGLEWLYRLSLEPARLWRRYLVDDISILRYFTRAITLRLNRRKIYARPGANA